MFAVLSEMKKFDLADHILLETIYLFCFYSLTKYFGQKNNYSKNLVWPMQMLQENVFLEFLYIYENIFWFFSITDLMFYNSLLRHENFRNFEQVENLPPFYLPYQFLHNLQ